MARRQPPDHTDPHATAGLTQRRQERGEPTSWSTKDSDHCHCCGRPGHRFGPLRTTDKGWTCGDAFCLAGTSGASR